MKTHDKNENENSINTATATAQPQPTITLIDVGEGYELSEDELRQQRTEENQNLLFKQQQLSNSIEPSIKETERFMLFLNERFNLNLKFNNITILISTAKPTTKGYFSPENNPNGFLNTSQKLNAIVLNTIHLKKTPYETIAHELAHFYNHQNNIRDCSKNNYHNKKFKETAERLLLNVERLDSKGFAYTKETPAFFEMLKEFKSDSNAFHISQNYSYKAKSKSRLYKWTCDCGFIIRCGDRTLKATCDLCQSEFKLDGENE